MLSSAITIYNQFKHGDIVFTKEYISNYSFTEAITQYFNYGIAHTLLVIEENGIKYLINATPGKYKKHILQTYTYVGKWVIVKEPLLDFIKKFTCIYQVYRHPSPKPIRWSKRSHPTYCSQVVGSLLYDATMIQESEGLLSPYTPERLIELLLQNGYTYFEFKQL